MSRLALLIAAALPLAATAQSAPASTPQPDPADAPTAGAPSQPAPAPTPPAGARPAVHPSSAIDLELGGWLVWSAFSTFGALDDNQLPRAAVIPSTERTFGMTVRQSRLRAALSRPADGLLAGAQLQGLAELDFMGGYASSDQAFPLVRLRHAWVSATWQRLANLSVLVGQDWGLVGGTSAPASLGHTAVPRFSGAGYLYHWAPQLRISAETAGPLAVLAQLAVLAPIDRATSPAPTTSGPPRPPPTGVGERSGVPDVEGRVALRWSAGSGGTLEAGLSGHAGREMWRLAEGTSERDAHVDSYAGALDARLELPWVTALAGAYLGKNLDVLSTLSAGVTLTPSSTTDLAAPPSAVTGVQVWGGWGQLQVRPLPALTLLFGAGLEEASASDLPAAPPSGTVPRRNLQGSVGALLDLDRSWQAGVEYTAYQTTYVGTVERTLTSGQLEVATRYAF